MRRFTKVALASIVALGATSAVGPVAQASDFTGTCLESPNLACSATPGQTYNGVTLGVHTPGGNDSEAAVEAVLSHVIGPPADVAPAATGLTGDSGDFDVTPNRVTDGTSFAWTYRGTDEHLAYLTVKAGNGFAVFGIAGRTSGTVDLAGLTGGHDISHIGFWTTNLLGVTPVPARKLHGDGFFGNTRLAKIDNGTVACLHVETTEPTTCTFTKRGNKSGAWLESPRGDYARMGQAVTLDGKPGGNYVIASKINTDGTVPALEPTGHDMAGTPLGMELAGSCVAEDWNVPTNRTGYQMDNWATLEVHTGKASPYDTGATLIRTYEYTSSSGSGTVYVYKGEGAGFNDPNGTERGQHGYYLNTTHSCHVGLSGGYEVMAAKRPATKGYPARVDPLSPTVWRPVSSLKIAN